VGAGPKALGRRARNLALLLKTLKSEIPLRRLTDRNDSMGRVITQTTWPRQKAKILFSVSAISLYRDGLYFQNARRTPEVS